MLFADAIFEKLLPLNITHNLPDMVGLAVVVADAMMLDTVLGLDVRGDDARAAPGAPRVGREGGGAWMEPAPEQREVEGVVVVGAFWYEAPH